MKVNIRSSCILILTLSFFFLVDAQSRTPRFDIDVGRHKYLSDFGQRVKDACTKWYSSVARYLSTPGYKDPDSILIRFDPNYDGVAYAEWDKSRITGATKYYRENQNDVGSMIHEMVHIIQRYPGNCPGWFVEGLADYIRCYQYENCGIGKPGGGQSYRDGYKTTAYFLNHLTENINGGKNAVLTAHKGCRERSYRDSIWQELTGRNLDGLWNEMQNNF